jgi:protein phosphatase
MNIDLPDPSLVVLVGPSGCGKSTFARAHFRPTEILSSDALRAVVSDDEADQSATHDAFEALHLLAAKRLARGRLTVVDATNVRAEARRPLLRLARQHHLPAVAIVFDLPEETCLAWNAARPARAVEPHIVRRHLEQLERSRRGLRGEGFRRVWWIVDPAQLDAATVARAPLPADRRGERGPFDIVGDVHGCADELEELLGRLGYEADARGVPRHAEGRRLVFVGDLVDRGPRIADVLRLVMRGVEAGTTMCVQGNHDEKLLRALRGRPVKIAHGLERSLDELARESPELRDRVCRFIAGLPSHLLLDEGRLVVAHAGMREAWQGRDSPRVRDFALYGDTTGESDEFGLPVRLDWAAEYQGEALVVYGHTPVAEPRWMNRAINIDTGCVFGGRLTALRYPELELVSVPAREVWAQPRRPFLPTDAPSPPDAPTAILEADPRSPPP